jgi:hypothetical protein
LKLKKAMVEMERNMGKSMVRITERVSGEGEGEGQ